MLGRRTLIGLTSPDVRTVPGARSRVTAHTRVLESAAAMVTAPATIEPITSKTPATRRKSNQLGVFARRGAGEVVATCLRPFQPEVGRYVLPLLVGAGPSSAAPLVQARHAASTRT